MPWVLADIPAVITGLMAVLALLGAYALLQLLARAFDDMLGVGWFSRGLDHIWRGIGNALNAIGGWLDGLVAEIANFFYQAVGALDQVMGVILETTRRAFDWIRYLFRTWVPQLIGDLWGAVNGIYQWAIGWVSGLINQVYSWAIGRFNDFANWVSGLYNSLAGWISSLVNGVYAWATGWFNEVMAYARSVYDTLSAWVNSLYASLVGWVTSQFQGLVAWIESVVTSAIQTAVNIAIDWARTYANQAIEALVSALAIAAGLPLAPAWPRVLDAIDAIAAALPGALADILARIGAIPRALPRSLAGILSAIGALAAVGVDWIKECGVPLCRKLGGFGDEIAALEDAELILDLLELAEAVIHDPRGSARDAADAFTDLVTAASAGLFDAVSGG